MFFCIVASSKQKISVVLICKNESHIIGKTLAAALPIADEIIVYDTGSTDETVSIARSFNARVIEGEWEGYGTSKQKAIKAATHDWILNIDSDEVLDEQLQQSILQCDLADTKVAYKIKFKNFIGRRYLKWGEFGFDHHIRLFHRQHVNWSNGKIHEQLLVPEDVDVQRLKGHILHFTMKDTEEFVKKSVHYGLLNALEYYKKGRKATWIKQYLAPTAIFIKYYILRLGILDGWTGFFAARMSALYTYIKYTRLREYWENGSRD
jgi:glycosyltransferase involved in cell wall biosynthesis